MSLRAPLVTVMEELENRDLLSFLWRCREVPLPTCLSFKAQIPRPHVETGLIYQQVNKTFVYFGVFLKEKVTPPCEMTERRIFTMAKQVASALVSMSNNVSDWFRPQV